MNDDNIDAFLEHHGIKGQKWGLRRQNQKQLHLNRINRVANGTATKQDKQLIKARRVGVASLVGSGAIVALILKHNSNVKINDLKKQVTVLNAGRKAVSTFALNSQAGRPARQAIARGIQTKFL